MLGPIYMQPLQSHTHYTLASLLWITWYSGCFTRRLITVTMTLFFRDKVNLIWLSFTDGAGRTLWMLNSFTIAKHAFTVGDVSSLLSSFKRPFLLTKEIRLKSGPHSVSQDWNSFAQSLAFLSQLIYSHRLRSKVFIQAQESMKGLAFVSDPRGFVGSHSGCIELSPECATANRSGFKPN